MPVVQVFFANARNKIIAISCGALTVLPRRVVVVIVDLVDVDLVDVDLVDVNVVSFPLAVVCHVVVIIVIVFVAVVVVVVVVVIVVMVGFGSHEPPAVARSK